MGFPIPKRIFSYNLWLKMDDCESRGLATGGNPSTGLSTRIDHPFGVPLSKRVGGK
jgi:hypothetical protein